MLKVLLSLIEKSLNNNYYVTNNLLIPELLEKNRYIN